jgi:hypothetical protein
VVHLPKLLEKYSDFAEFLLVYTDETEMTTGSRYHELPEPLRESAEPPDAPQGSRLRLEQRVRAGKEHFGLQMPCLIDNEQREVKMLYHVGAKRLLIVDKTGHIAFDSGNSTTGVFPWQKVTDWLDHYGESASPRSAGKHG